jgi:hypothetical protein
MAEAIRDKVIQFDTSLWHLCRCWSEFPIGDKGRKFKGRVIRATGCEPKLKLPFSRTWVTPPATMDASGGRDCYGCFPGHKTEIADAVQVYIQARLKGISVDLFTFPAPRQPLAFRKPVVELFQAVRSS